MKAKNGIKVCLIGSGRAGMIHGKNFASLVDGAVVAAVVDPVEQSRWKACEELGAEKGYACYQQAIEDKNIDAIIVATPTKYHKEIVVEAAKVGKHILCEKPMAMNLSECDEMLMAVDKAGVKLQIGFMRRFDKSFLEAKNRIESGEIGDVVQVRSITYGPSIPKPWMYDISKSNGPLAEVNSHDIDTLRWYTNSEFKEVYAIANNYRCPEAKTDFPDFYDNVLLTAKFENSIQGSIGGAQGVQYGYDSRCEILGTKGIILVGELSGSTMMSCSVNGMNKPIVKSWTNLFERAYLAEDLHFIECIVRDEEPRVTGYDGRMAVAVVNAGNKSIKEGKIVSV